MTFEGSNDLCLELILSFDLGAVKCAITRQDLNVFHNLIVFS